MKKFIILFAVLILTAGFAIAEDTENPENIGLTGHLELGIGGINKPNDAEEAPLALDIGLAYEKSFFDGAWDINAMLVYGIIFTKAPGMDGKEQYPQLLRLVFMTGYNHKLGEASTLSGIIQNENYFILAPDVGDDNATGVIKPGIKFEIMLENVGILNVQTNFPFAYLNFGQEKDNTWAGLDLTAGFMSGFGLGLAASFHFMFTPKEDMFGQTINGFTGVAVNAMFMAGQFLAQARAAIPVKNMDIGARYSYFDELTTEGGAALNLEIAYFFIPGLKVYAGAAFTGMGITGRDMVVSPMIGVDYSF